MKTPLPAPHPLPLRRTLGLVGALVATVAVASPPRWDPAYVDALRKWSCEALDSAYEAKTRQALVWLESLHGLECQGRRGDVLCDSYAGSLAEYYWEAAMVNVVLAERCGWPLEDR